MVPLPEKADVIVERWKQEMQRLPVPVHIQLVEGEAGERLARLAEILVACMRDQLEAERFRVGGGAYADAEALGRLRRRQGLSIEELVQEHIVMRNEFWNVFHEHGDMKQAVDFGLEKTANGCFDLILQAAASAYHFEHSREMMENPLRDGATGLYNKSYFHGRMVEELRRCVRYEHEITLVLFEIGNYFEVKGLTGGESEDLLRVIAGSLSRMTRGCDVVARLGEGSFGILLPETGWRGGKVMAERLWRYFLEDPAFRSHGGEELRLLWGVAAYPEEVVHPERLYACAVEAMRSSRDLDVGEIAVYRGPDNREEG